MLKYSRINHFTRKMVNMTATIPTANHLSIGVLLFSFTFFRASTAVTPSAVVPLHYVLTAHHTWAKRQGWFLDVFLARAKVAWKHWVEWVLHFSSFRKSNNPHGSSSCRYHHRRESPSHKRLDDHNPYKSNLQCSYVPFQRTGEGEDCSPRSSVKAPPVYKCTIKSCYNYPQVVSSFSV